VPVKYSERNGKTEGMGAVTVIKKNSVRENVISA
jgi:hypothetical protein